MEKVEITWKSAFKVATATVIVLMKALLLLCGLFLATNAFSLQSVYMADPNPIMMVPVENTIMVDSSFNCGVVAGQKVNCLLLRGEIKEGDYEKIKGSLLLSLTSWMKNYSFKPYYVFLDSPGGDAREAMKIGRLIRELGIGTAVGLGDRCASSCSLIWMAGLIRDISYTGTQKGKHSNDYKLDFVPLEVHRTYFKSSEFFDLPRKQARKQFEAMQKEVGDYLDEIDTPKEIIELIFNTASNNSSLINQSKASEIGFITFHYDDFFYERVLACKNIYKEEPFKCSVGKVLLREQRPEILKHLEEFEMISEEWIKSNETMRLCSSLHRYEYGDSVLGSSMGDLAKCIEEGPEKYLKGLSPEKMEKIEEQIKKEEKGS